MSLPHRPAGASDDAVEAAGRMTEALETLERARGHLYAFHQLTGSSDLALDDVVELLRADGRDALADDLERELVGHNVLAGRWTFQLVEEFDDGHYALFREHERRVRDELTGGVRHVHEAEMKERRRTPGRPGHEATPDEAGG
ncbi:hypothetical protein [Paraconexibacter algicola]|uniref:Uncharacterized protein n=1 Tax=Paraconexibacter algicola TaxID=2133960 RepID=A0A2T4UL68_9ACTN|nr:hypothetical protein [Paraconexibacter algicola]PTL59983.1 hypothetical protein C7Y72_10160 [Paraconexibacter algicola]